MTKITIKKGFSEKIREGWPLLTKEMVQQGDYDQEGRIFTAIDPRGHFLAKGYLGRQNKGSGWLLTWDQHEEIDEAFFKKKIESAASHREAFFEDNQTDAFRLFNGEGDGIGGLTIDHYAGHYLFTWYSKGIYDFRDEILHAFEQVLPFKSIYEKKRFDSKGQYVEDDDFVKGERPDFPLVVKENGAHFAVYLNDGAMTGVFLDQRNVRKAIRDKYAEGKNMLNTFSYTGAFSVFAALGGAVKTTSVDLANRSVPKTIEQFSMNGIDYEAQDILVRDVFRYFNYCVKNDVKFDLVVMDPPSFARSKKHTFSASKDYKNLVKQAIDITEKKGVIVASTNAASFDMKKFKSFIDQAFKEKGMRYKIIETFSLPDDFRTAEGYPPGDYLKVCVIQTL
ncbi:class I SAM-dependent rRNA methyltransferase [Jeotgalibacillus terrae]|uniref:Class I SAM-dependent rRNA methyltransferase n=1 Tax=Jeotgalibacillus terrae TaxID=587735 RepID=A0ABW5ZH26_9BACL|nr:class I SAM-dependent rRNA methyltransferase [Jeotgalibacillus terrae]MBM7579031.1 23S rRNA (cytosine1962-C5)-methyltransferase [Jeotgalibacillus terrae]